MDTEGRLERYRDADRWPTERIARGHARQSAGGVRGGPQRPAGAGAGGPGGGRPSWRRGRLIYVGAGASGRLAVQDGVELYPTFGWPNERLVYLMAGGEAALVRSLEGAEDDAAAGEQAIAGLWARPEPTSWSRWPPRAPRPSPARRRRPRGGRGADRGAGQQPDAPLLAEAEIPVLLHTGPEFLAGSTRMTAGTAQKIALNLLSTQLMIELGRVYQGLMVNVVPSNAKLVARSQRIVQALAGCAPGRPPPPGSRPAAISSWPCCCSTASIR